MAGLTWTRTPDQAFPELARAYIAAIHRGVLHIANQYAPEIETWMKQNAPWTDRTGNARQSLYTEVRNVINEMVTIGLHHGVSYGIYLELRNAGRFAVIAPALDYFAPRIWADVRRMLAAI